MDGGRAWADDFESLTLGLVRDRGPGWVVATALGSKAIEFVDRGAAEAWTVAAVDPAHRDVADQYNRTYVSLVRVSGWTVLWSDFGLAWTDEEVVRNLSQGGEFLCCTWGTGDLHRFQAARDGEIIRSFDPWFREEDPIGAPLPEENAIEWRSDTYVPGILLLEQVSGLGSLDLSWRDLPEARVFGYPI